MRFLVSGILALLLLNTVATASTRFENIRDTDQSLVNKKFKGQLEAPNPQLADDLVRFLMATGVYTSVEVFDQGDGRYMVVGETFKKLGEIDFKGLESLDEIDALNAMALKPGSQIDTRQLETSADSLRELYGRSGYFSPEIDIQVTAAKTSEVPLVVTIKENAPCRIESVTIQSTNPAVNELLKQTVKGFKNKVFSERILGEMEAELREFLQDRRMFSARLTQKDASYNSEKTKAHLVYELSDPYSYKIQTSGNIRYTYGDMIRFADLKGFDQSSLNPAAEIAERIRRAYIQRGHHDAKVSFQQITDEKNFSKQVNITIFEGPRARIEKIEVLGRLSRSPRYYRKFIQNNSTESVEDDLYVSEDLALGYKNLVTELNNQGYLRATIQSTRAEFNPERNRVVIQVLLDEGPLTQIKNIKFIGNSSFTEPELLNVIGLYPNSPLRLNQLELGIQNIKDFYRSAGHLEMAITNERSDLVTYDEKGYEANILFNIQEGPQIMVREILVEGNTFTRDYVVKNEIDIDVGDVLTPNAIEEAQKRLDRLNIFSRVELRTLEANTNVSQRTLLVSVVERNPGSFRMGLGLTNKRQLTARGFAGISYNNLGGTARAVSFRVNAENNLVLENYLEYEVLAGYLEPFLFGSKFRGRLNLSVEERVIDTIETAGLPDTNRIERNRKLALVTERDITSKIRFSWNFWTLESIEEFQVPSPLPGFDRTLTQVATIGPLIDIDYRDNPFLPTKGTFTRIEADYSSPDFGSSDKVEFARVQSTFTYYQALWSPKWVWANSVRGGYAKNLSQLQGSGIPAKYAFVLGGFTTIRGYSGVDDDRIPPTSLFGSNTLVVPDDTDYFLYKSELRYPIYDIVGGVLFYDAGRVDIAGLTPLESDRYPLKQAVGIGIRLNTPVGPISLDYARKINPIGGESPDHIHLSIGTF